MRVATVLGNRPQFIKAAAVSKLLRGRHEELLIHTGAHHDPQLSAVFFEELELPAPDHDLGVSGGSNSSQLGRMLEALEPLLARSEADLVLVYGDTNSTLAGALAAVDCALPLVHVEAGMRSGDLSEPEERNRLLTDQLATLLLCSSAAAVQQLEREGVPGRRELVGDVMVDVAMRTRARVEQRGGVLERFGLVHGEYVLATAHRAATVDDPQRLAALLTLLEAVELPVVLPLHPRTRARLSEHGLLERAAAAVQLSEPLGYLDFAALLHHARALLTDSGGAQKEAYLARVPCVTLRAHTEWVETVASGWNTLVGLDRDAARAALAAVAPAEHPPLYGDGDAGARILAALESLSGG